MMTFRIKDEAGPLSVVLRLPTPEGGVYDIDGTFKAIVLEGRRGVEYPVQPNRVGSIWVRNKDEVITELIGKALDATLVSAAKGSPPAEQMGQEVIDRFFATSPLVRVVDPDKLLDMEMTKDTIHIDVSGSSLDVEDRRIRDWHGVVDPLTTPQGIKAMQTFRLSGGTEIVNGRIQRGQRLLSPVMERCLSSPENTNPTRLLITRSALAKHETLVRAEDPLVHHEDYESGELQGIHLFTGIMGLRHNYSDCVVISQSAAQKLSCYRRLTQTVTDTHPMQVLVKVGDNVSPDQPIVAINEGANDKGKPKIRQIHVRRLVTDARVVDLRRFETHVLGEPAEKIRLKFECVYVMGDGDKLTTRYGNKGVVRVIPDREMPEVRTREGWRRLEAAIHPLSMVKRRPHGLFREMMLNRLSLKRGEPIVIRHFGGGPSMRKLVGMKLGKKRKTRHRGRVLPEPVYAGPVYWLRLDMHAREQLAAMGHGKPLNFIGLNPDAGKVSGQRVNLGIATVMYSKGLGQVHKALHEANVETGAQRLVEDLMSVLAYDGQARRRRE